jgi:hypothetical protein
MSARWQAAAALSARPVRRMVQGMAAIKIQNAAVGK